MTIKVGLEFTSTTFRAKAKITAIRKDQNEIDVILDNGDGFAWEEKGWNLAHTIAGFKRKEYTAIDNSNKANYSII